MQRSHEDKESRPQDGFLLYQGERLDDLQRNGAKLIQNPDLFCFGMDAVLLSAYAEANVKPGSRVLDLCSGNGVIPVLMDARYQDRMKQNKQEGRAEDRRQPAGPDAPDAKGCGRQPAGHGASAALPEFLGIEINPVCADMAARSAAGNGQSERVYFRKGDLCGIRDLVKAASFSLVTVNPPYMIGGHGLTGDNDALTCARHEVLCSLDDVCAAAEYALMPQGRLCMVHRPFRLADIFRSLNAHRLEPKRMRLVQPMAGKEPNMVLIEAVRGGRPRLSVETPLIIYEKPGVYTEEVRQLYG